MIAQIRRRRRVKRDVDVQYRSRVGRKKVVTRPSSNSAGESKEEVKQSTANLMTRRSREKDVSAGGDEPVMYPVTIKREVVRSETLVGRDFRYYPVVKTRINV